MYKVGICGCFGFGRNMPDGQTVKTRNVAFELEHIYGSGEVCKVDSYGGKAKIISLIFKIFNLVKKSKNVIILPAQNGLLVFTPLVSAYNCFFRRKLHYVVIGGWLPEYLDKHKITRHLLKRFNKIYVETSMMKSKLEMQGFTNVLVMPNFKNLKITKNIAKQEFIPFKLCTFSRILYEKGIEHAIEAIKLLNKNGEQNCTLDIYGEIDMNYKEKFESICSDNPPYIHYMGCVNPEQSTDIISKYHALLFPTLYTDVEGFPGTMIDAFAASTPVVAYDWVNNDDIVVDHENGLLCSEKTVESLADSVHEIMKNEELYQKLTEGCFKSAEKYSADNVMGILVAQLN